MIMFSQDNSAFEHKQHADACTFRMYAMLVAGLLVATVKLWLNYLDCHVQTRSTASYLLQPLSVLAFGSAPKLM
jgi:hypothetical protein